MSRSSAPTRVFNGFHLRAGDPTPFGATVVPGGVNFSVCSTDATSCALILYRRGEEHPFARIPFFDDFRVGNVYCMIIFDLEWEDIEYGFSFDGPHSPKDGLLFDKTRVLNDPYAKLLSGREIWGEGGGSYRSRICVDDFDWEGDRPLEREMRDLIIYEMHVRGFTRGSWSGVTAPGTYEAVIEKIPYLKELGINCVELMPVFEFDETENTRVDDKGRPLLNYWGYSTAAFFAPKAGYARGGVAMSCADEFKTMVRELHAAGIEVILDVVFNHTAEMGADGPYISFRGIDNKTYYMLTADGNYQNFSGCGNTMNCNHPIVRMMILECLRYWTSAYHIDGFRFDLASILGRDQFGVPMGRPPLIEALAHDPVLGRTKLIAEAWDAGGLYQVGSFPSWGRWAEWNGRYRDDVRRFLKGDFGMAKDAAHALMGSPHIYDPASRGNCASINFITCHDGFTMMDLYSYQHKMNDVNGEEGRDGSNDNHSWDCVLPGDDPEERRALRHRMVKNALAFLLLSHSVPMLLAGDEFGNSQNGNNNAYCQDNQISWLDWGDLVKNSDIFEFAKKMIKLRTECDCLKSPRARRAGGVASDPGIIALHGLRPYSPDLSPGSTLFAATFSDGSSSVYAAFNMHWEPHTFVIPAPPAGKIWMIWEDTWRPDAADSPAPKEIEAGPRSVIVLRAIDACEGSAAQQEEKLP